MGSQLTAGEQAQEEKVRGCCQIQLQKQFLGLNGKGICSFLTAEPGLHSDGEGTAPAFMTHSGGDQEEARWPEVGWRNGWHLLATTVTTNSVQAKDKAPDCECFSWAPNPFLGAVALALAQP